MTTVQRDPGRQSFTADDLIAAYRRGVFPMADARRDPRVYLVDPARRGIIPLERPRVPARLARTVRAGAYEIRLDTAFEEVIEGCAAPGPGRHETWINGVIQRLFLELRRREVAHSVEVWREGRLVGGLYGAAIGGAFFGESMFSRRRDASKIALVHLLARLRRGGFTLLDAQFVTAHLEQFGALEIARADYHHRLAQALSVQGDFLALDPQADGAAALQAISQVS